jgi:hypothetical protein
MAASAVGGFALAALLFSPQISAQPGGSKSVNGIFSTLRVGQMVEFTTDGWGVVISTYDDEELKLKMRHQVKELGDDYVVVEFDDKNGTGALAEFRVPVYRFSQVNHLGKMDPSKKPAGISPHPLDDKTAGKSDKTTGKSDKKPTGSDKKPGATKPKKP